MKQYSKISLLLLGMAALGWSFWSSAGWLQLCAGLALFLFGMQCLVEGLKALAGGALEQLLSRSTATPLKGLLFGTLATSVLQSSTLVCLLTIAFLSTGLITLAGGISVIFGANLGATTGIWLLAMAGQKLSLSPLALPMLVFGVLASYFSERGKAVGQMVLGIAFIFLGIDQIKDGFSSLGDGFDLSAYQAEGIAGVLLFIGLGTLITIVLQSSHATMILAMAAMASGQLGMDQSLAVAIGSKVGTSLSTALVGMLGSNRSGQRLALVHVTYACVAALAAFILFEPYKLLVLRSSQWLGVDDNPLLQLAMFYTLFTVVGIGLFWTWQKRFADFLLRVWPDEQEPEVLITEVESRIERIMPETRARYLTDSALGSADSAASAVAQELQHLERLSLEVICHGLYLPVSQLYAPQIDETLLYQRPPANALDADSLYQRHIKGVHADLLSFMGRLDMVLDEAHQAFWISSQVAALQLVDAVKDAKHLQKNLGRHLSQETDSAMRQAYVELRRQLLHALREVNELNRSSLPEEQWNARLQQFDDEAAAFDARFRQRLFAGIRSGELDGLQTSSLMNDLGYTSRIIQSLRNVLMISEGHELSRQLRALFGQAQEPLIQLS
ncbi:MAG TPA: Na/Pi symporter [Pseudomonas sp.]|nr:Na/Pi symporter [Pseudomonas sp.]